MLKLVTALAVVVLLSGCVRMYERHYGASEADGPNSSDTSTKDLPLPGDSPLVSQEATVEVDAAKDTVQSTEGLLKSDGTPIPIETGVVCGSWNDWSCNGPINICTATCDPVMNTTWTIACTIGMGTKCTCSKGGGTPVDCGPLIFKYGCVGCQVALTAGCCKP